MKNTFKTFLNNVFAKKDFQPGTLIHKEHGEPLVYVGKKGKEHYALSLFHKDQVVKLDTNARYKSFGNMEPGVYRRLMASAQNANISNTCAVFA